jgi:hypothetical protein
VELINWIWFAGAIASAATLGIADGKARNIQPIEALWLALLWVTETLLAAMQFGRNWHKGDIVDVRFFGRNRGQSRHGRKGRKCRLMT